LISAPVLFVVFRRPDTTRMVFEAIRAAKPTRLYVAADGPRVHRLGEKALCDEVREIATAVDWECEVRTLFRETNLGCREAVSTALDWFFESEKEGIVLEDDCLPDQSFFRFCEELLERYRHDRRIMVIAGNHFHGSAHKPTHSYFFSRYNHCWGWASWRRAWREYDREMSQWPSLKSTDWLMRIGDGHRDFREYWQRVFDTAYAGEIDTWDYMWTFSCWTQNGLTVLPSRNLVKNVGFGKDSSHTGSDGGWISRLPLESISFPLDHPSDIVRDRVADRWTDLNYFGTRAPLYKRIIRGILGLRWGRL